ncbi:hypothetical protein EVAR_70143_1, partial [Eumeta japonica]
MSFEDMPTLGRDHLLRTRIYYMSQWQHNPSIGRLVGTGTITCLTGISPSRSRRLDQVRRLFAGSTLYYENKSSSEAVQSERQLLSKLYALRSRPTIVS